jgi:CheY-like chemotaxis protein
MFNHKELPEISLNCKLQDVMEHVMPDENNRRLENGNNHMKTILLVEDDSIISELLVQMITQETHYKIFTVPDGLEALDLVRNIKPQLLILDYWLPTIHGIELYDRLHTTEGLEEVPTIMLSVNAPLREINQRQIMYIRKPFDIYKLLEAIHRLLV